MKMKFEDFKLGQVVKHRRGFVAVVIKIEENTHDKQYSDVILKVIESGNSEYPVGYEYRGLPSYCTLLKDVETKVNKSTDNNTKNNSKLTIDVEVNGLEALEELTQLTKEETVFEAELGNGISFEGTKSDFEVFMKGVKEMMELALKLGNKAL